MAPPGTSWPAAALRSAGQAGWAAANRLSALLSPAVGPGQAPLRDFDPRRTGELEAATWAAYYRREWARVLPLAVQLTREVYDLPWPASLQAAVLVARATRAWAPQTCNDPAEATRRLRQLYELVFRTHRLRLDPHTAAELEVHWWRVHRRLDPGETGYVDRIGDALAAAYAYVYQRPRRDLAEAGRWRAEAMRLSDQGMLSGVARDGSSSEVTSALVRSHTALHAAVR